MTTFIYTEKSIQIKLPIAYQWKRKITNITKLKNPKAFSDYSQTIDDIYEFLEEFNSKKEKC